MGVLSDVTRPIRESVKASDKALTDSYRKAIERQMHKADEIAFDLSIHAIAKAMDQNKKG